ncbi:MAG: tol-pal system protein YbgF [Desulfovibrio sp.]|nr:tol-pal system protein YbgF [Desulfovibrio sp.]
MKNFLTIPALALALGLIGCASTGQVDKLESTSETNTKLLRENEFRLHQLETSMASLNSQVAQLNNRVYEVRTRNGKKTSMTVVPIVPPAATTGAAPAAAPTGAPGAATAAQASQPTSRAEALLAQARRAAAERNQAAQATTQGAAPATAQAGAVPAATGAQAAAAAGPKGRIIDPAAAPTPIPAPTPRAQAPAQRQATATASAGASGSVGRPVAGPSGTLAAQPATSPAALPPLDLPPTTLPAASPATTAQTAASQSAAPRANAVSGAASTVPVPSIPASSLALPPEHPGLPPVGQPLTSEPGAPQKALASPAQPASPAPAARAASPRGEEAAYKAALNATLAGRTDEGLRLFHDFLQEYPHGRYAANADYWIGEGLYAQGKYPEALAQFQKVNDAYPQHHKNADALLKAGMTMSRLGDRTAAAEKYRTLMTQFPNSDAARRARAMGVAR